MKTWKFFIAVLVVALIATSNSTNAQTVQRNLNADFEEAVYIPCADVWIQGTATFHFTYHLDKKTGKIDRIHWNVIHQDLKKVETGEKFIIIDTGSDNMGLNFAWFNNMNSSNGLVGVYDVEDGWLNEYMPENVFNEGSYVEMVCKFIVGGEVYSMSFMTQLHKNANGEITADNSKTIFKCIE
jgi:hypothetical protein